MIALDRLEDLCLRWLVFLCRVHIRQIASTGGSK
jgi:hypothetical protein